MSIFNYNSPPSWHNCTSGAPLPYSATQCRRPYNRPPYIEKSLPGLLGGRLDAKLQD